ncbi:MAG: hypothetical protein K8H74_00570 [Notoacmeibacter sp.]|nr:hypothetical protein [Notoacmeibacter sp.]
MTSLPDNTVTTRATRIARDRCLLSLPITGAFETAARAGRHASIGGIENHPNIDKLLEMRPDVTCASPCTPPPVGCDDAGAALLVEFQMGNAGVNPS